MLLPDDATAPGQARRFLEESHCSVHGASVLDDAKLLVSELVTNAIRHGSPPIELQVECVGDRGLEVRVRDAGTTNDLEVVDRGDNAVDGRGLRLVDLLSKSWGTASGPDGKDVWFRVLPETDA